MPTDSTVQHSETQPEPQVGIHSTDATKDSALAQSSAAQVLTADQLRVLDQLLAPLDRANIAVRVGFFGKRMADRNLLLDYLGRPSGVRRVRTPEHHKVVSMRLDALNIPEGLQPWHYLTLSAIEVLTESALPNERMALNELRIEANRLIRIVRRDQAAAELPALAFARHFQSAFPRLVQNTISLTNSVLLIILNQVDEVEPASAAQWLEASQYFCATAGCAVLLSADEKILVDLLNRSTEGAEGNTLLKEWVTHRVNLSGGAAQPRPAMPTTQSQQVKSQAVELIDTAPRSPAHPVSRRSTHGTDVPASSARIIREVLSPNTAEIQKVMAQWHIAMQAVIRRAEQGLGGSISATLIAKLVSLHALAPALYDTARYDAQMLLAIERASKGDESSDAYPEWISQVNHQPRLVTLFSMDPSFSNFDLRDLATGLRLTSSDDVMTAVALDAPSIDLAHSSGHARKAVAEMAAVQSTMPEEPTDATQLAFSPTLATTVLVAAAVFLIDRVVKLIVQSMPIAPSGAFIRPEYLVANMASGDLWRGGLGVGAELFGLVLAIMIAIFWGNTRRQAGHDFGLGLVIGALASNLFDRLVYGSVLNYAHLPGLPVFNLSHVAVVAGGLMIAWSLLRGPIPEVVESV